MAAVGDSAFGAILEIPDSALAKIREADNRIAQLAVTSMKASGEIKRHWESIAAGGMDAFIKKINDANTALSSLKMPPSMSFDLDVKSSDSRAISSLSEDVTKLAANMQNLSDRTWEWQKAMSSSASIVADYAAKMRDLAKAIEASKTAEAMTKDNAALKLAKTEYREIIQAIDAAMVAQRRFMELMANPTTSATDKARYSAQLEETRKQLETLNNQRLELETKHGDKLTAIAAKNAKRQADAELTEHERAEKKKIKATEDAEKRRSAAVIRAARERAAEETALNRQATRQRANDAAANKERRLAHAYDQVVEAIKRTRAEIDALNKTDKNYQQEVTRLNQQLNDQLRILNRLSSGSRALRDEHERTRRVMSKLRDAAFAIFSVRAITGYIKKMVEVRAQFELQQVALRAILQNKDEADRIFMQVQQMALQSPFSIMQLTTYTKQLAAYRIEANKLVGTTKMLADVSAGLGVDIQRLILAYGQVKSSNYLRACLSGDCDVLMYDSTYKKAKDIAVGDVLMGDDEKPRHVSELYQGEQMMYRVIYDGGEFRCNEHHILTVFDALTMRIVDIFILDYLKEPHRYQGVRRIDGRYEVLAMHVVQDKIDAYYGFSIDGNRRFIIKDNIVTHNTEIRQFTEAGLNIAGELATYFTELQGRMVSVGEVMEMVTKRMVRFEDVEEVFKRVTSAGGLFYDMQRKQSETIQGQLQRITDAYSIMLNEIGMSNHNAISGALSLIREMIQSWRTLLPIIESVGVAMALGGAAKGVALLVLNFSKLVLTVKRLAANLMLATKAFKTLTAAQASTGIGAIAAVVGLLGMAIYEVVTHTTALEEALERIGKESLDDMKESVGNFVRLADVISDATKTYTEHQEALDELKRSYRDILPEQKMQSDYIKNLNGDYRELISTITEYYQTQEYHKKVEAVISGEDYKNLLEELKDAGKEMLKKGLFDPYVTQKQVDAFMEVIAREIAEGKLEANMQSLGERMRDYFGQALKSDKPGAYFGDAIDAARKLRKEIDDLTVSTIEGRGYLEDVDRAMRNRRDSEIVAEKRTIEEARAALEKATAEMEQKLLHDEGIQWGRRKNAIAANREQIERLKTKEEEYNRVIASRYAAKYADRIKETTSEINKQVEAYYKLNKDLKTFQANGTLTAKQQAKLTDSMNEAYESAHNLAAVYGVELDSSTLESINSQHALAVVMQNIAANVFPKVKTAAFDSLSEVEKRMLQASTSTDELRKAFERLGLSMGVNFADDLNSATSALDEQLNAAQDMRDVIAGKHGVFAFDLDIDKAGDENIKAYAARLRKKAEEDAKTVKDYLAAVAKGYADADGAANGYTKAQIERLDKTSKAQAEYADRLYTEAEKETKGPKGTDPWQKRVSLIRELNSEYEKLLKYYSEEKADARIRDSYAQAVAEAFEGIKVNGKDLSDINNWVGFDKQGMIDELQNILTSGLTLKPEKRAELQKILGGLRATLEFDIEQKNIDRAKERIDELFGDYSISQEFVKLGLPDDLTRLFGREPVKNVAGLRRELELIIMDAEAAGRSGTEIQKLAADSAKRIAEMERKNQEERAKNYYKYLLESYSKGAQIQLKAQQEVNKIMASEQYDEWTKQAARRNIMLKAQADQQKQLFQEFQSSDYYIHIFSDLESASKESLQYVIARLTAMKEAFANMPADQVRAIVKQIESAQKALDNKGVFGNVRKDFDTYNNYLKNRKQWVEALNALSDDEAQHKARLVTEEEKLNKLILERDKNIQGSKAWEYQNKLVQKQQRLINVIKEELKELGIDIEKINSDLEDGEEAAKGIEKFFRKIALIANELSDTIGVVAESISNLTGAMSDSTQDTVDIMGDILSGVGEMAEGIGGIFKNPADVGSWFKAVKGLFKTLGTLFSIGDKKKQQQINKLKDKVEELDRAYQKLENTMERVYAFEDYVYGSRQLEQNLSRQLKSYEQMLELEKSKKKSSTDAIREFEDAIADLEMQLQDLRDERTQALGGIGRNEWASAAEDFMDVWFDAFREQGDGLDALNEKWEDYFKNLIVKQATMRVVSKRLAGLFDMVDRAVSANSDQGEKLTRAEIDALTQKRNEVMAGLNQELKDLMEAWGVFGGSGELLLSDLQKGISNITEAQAAAIEAYLNSIRFAVYEHTNQLNQLLELVRAQYGAGESPILIELRGIKSVLTTISDNLSRVMTLKNGNYIIRIG